MTHSRTNGRGYVHGLAIGLALGLVIGGASVAAAAFAKKGWDRFGPMFQQGYVAGFVDCLRIAKEMEPTSYLATQFPVPPKAKPIHWVKTINDMYEKPEHEKRPVSQMILIAGTALQQTFGPGSIESNPKQLEALREAIDRQRAALRRHREALDAAAKEAGGTAATDQKAEGEKSGEQAGGNGTGDTDKSAPEGSHGQGMMPEGSHPDKPVEHPE